MGMGNRIKELRKEKGYTQEQLGEIVGLKKSGVAKYENGRVENMKRSVIAKMAETLECSPSYLLAIDEDEVQTTIPVYGRVAAGIPFEQIEDIRGYEEITEDMARRGTYFCLSIHGQSMEPRMCEGDVVICRRQPEAEDGEIVIATVNGTDATCKRLKKYSDGIALVSTNPAFEPMHFTSKEVEELPVRIIGKVVELRAKFEKDL